MSSTVNNSQPHYALSIENISRSLQHIYSSESWAQAVSLFKKSSKVLYLGHGGNLAIADHAAIDLTRLTDKVGISPGSAIWVTSYANDSGWENWLTEWLKIQLAGARKEEVCAIVITSSFGAQDILNAVRYLGEEKIPMICITSVSAGLEYDKNIVEINLELDTYHDSEVVSLGLTYDLIVAAGYRCPKIGEKNRTFS